MRNTTAEVWEIDHLLGVLLKEVEAREISEDVRTETNNRKQDIRNQSIAANLFVKDETNESKPKCIYCGELRYSASCGRVTDLKARKNILNRDRRCYLCLRCGYNMKECNKQRNCRRCDGRHHQSICPRDLTKQNDKQAEDSSTNNASTSNQSTFAYSNYDATTIPVRVLMDCGSQRSYVTNHLKEKLGLQLTKTETLRLNTFGGDRFTSKRCDVVRLSLQGIGEDVEISAGCFPKICSLISTKIC